jgi:required for meiotic nuclear division protein 1
MLHDAWYIPQWSTKTVPGTDAQQKGEVFVFANGSFVCWGLDESGAHDFAQRVLRARKDVEVGRLKEAETEELDFVTDPTE